MIRHIFIGTFKASVNWETKRNVLADMKAMQDNIPGIVSQEIGFSTGWVGPGNQIVMTVDFVDKASFEGYMAHPYHAGHINTLGTEHFDRSSFVSAQFTF